MPETKYANKIGLSDGTILIDLTGDTIEPSDLASGVTAHDASGAQITGTSTKDSDTSEDTALVGEILSGRTAHARGAQLTGTMANRGAIAEVIDDKDDVVVVPVGYHDGTGTVQIDATEKAKLIPGNIKAGISLMGVVGDHAGADSVTAQAKTATPSWSQQTILPDSGTDYLSQVTVDAIPITEADNAAGGKTVTIG